jgi:NAD(P)-dependent dehydrogenase (short-subunit alcohol dehydrogenase family)
MGSAHAVAAAELGAHVYVADVSDGHDVVDHILSTGGAATAVYLDVTNEADWQRLVSLADDAGLTLRGLVNNAGVSFRHGFEDTPPPTGTASSTLT